MYGYRSLPEDLENSNPVLTGDFYCNYVLLPCRLQWRSESSLGWSAPWSQTAATSSPALSARRSGSRLRWNQAWSVSVRRWRRRDSGGRSCGRDSGMNCYRRYRGKRMPLVSPFLFIRLCLYCKLEKVKVLEMGLIRTYSM